MIKLTDLKEQESALETNIQNVLVEIKKMENEGITNVGRYNDLKNQLDNYQNKLTIVQQGIKEISGAADTAQQQLIPMFESFEVGGIEFSLRGIAKGESEYQILSAFLQQIFGDQAEKHATIIHSYQEEIGMLNDTVNDLSKVKAEYDDVVRQNLDLLDKVSDAEEKRDAAAREITQSKEEIKRLKIENDQLRSEQKTVVTNSNANLAEIAKQLHEAKPAVYNVRWKDDMRKNTHIATLAETDEEVEYSYLEKGKYRVLEGDELARFREEQEAKKLEQLAKETITHKAIDEVTPPSLPYADIQTDSISGKMVSESETVTREEFEALKQRVDKIENYVFTPTTKNEEGAA